MTLRVAAVALLLLTAACSGRAAPPTAPIPVTITLLTAQASFGSYLTDDAGRALYMWDADRDGSSTCYGDCATAWPPLTVGDAAHAGPGVDSSLIGTVTRKDGTHQVTYGGWPLYTFIGDSAAGQTKGQAFEKEWYVVNTSGALVKSAVAAPTPTTTSGGSAWG